MGVSELGLKRGHLAVAFVQGLGRLIDDHAVSAMERERGAQLAAQVTEELAEWQRWQRCGSVAAALAALWQRCGSVGSVAAALAALRLRCGCVVAALWLRCSCVAAAPESNAVKSDCNTKYCSCVQSKDNAHLNYIDHDRQRSCR